MVFLGHKTRTLESARERLPLSKTRKHAVGFTLFDRNAPFQVIVDNYNFPKVQALLDFSL